MRPFATIAAGATLLATVFASAPPAAAAPAVHTDKVCLPVHNPGDPEPQALFGERYWTRTPTKDTRTIVLVHGLAPKAHRYWDLAPDFSVARNLARAGYLVLAYDRLGHEKSPYRTGTGNQITAVGGQTMLHDVVDDVHHGTWTASAGGNCDAGKLGPAAGPGTDSVIVLGQSLGCLIVSGYPGRFHDVDAAIPVACTNNGLTPDFVTVAAPQIAKAVATGADQIVVEPDEATCARVFLHKPGLAPAGRDYCRGGSPPTPFGELREAAAVYPNNLTAIARVGPDLPVLLSFVDHDEAFSAEQAAAEVEYWKAACECDVETWTQAEAGHAGAAHATMPTFTAKVVDWLRAKNLGPR